MIANLQALGPDNYCILVVDDDFILNQLFASFLMSKGFDVVSAEGVVAAENILRTRDDIDLMLLDYQLEDGLGVDLLEVDRVAHYLSKPPVIMISVNEDAEYLEECFRKGIADYIIKPVNLSLLALKVKSLINSVKLQRLISAQNIELEAFKRDAEREEQVAKFTYEYLLRQNTNNISGVQVFARPHSAFSGDISLAKISPSGEVYFMLADATGHGLSAAITIMPMVSIFNTMVSKGFHLHQIVSEINRKLVNDTPEDRFVAAVFIELNPAKNSVSVWNGAMPSVYWVDQGEIKHRFNSANMALGILDEAMFDANVETIPMPSGGFIFACSDGVIEQENAREEQFSKSRLESLLVLPGDTGELVLTELEFHAGECSYKDDVSICVLHPESIFDPEWYGDVPRPGLLQQERGDFSWKLRVSGQYLEMSELAPLCNHFLQSLGFNQRFCQRVFSVIGEMVSNAIDHGVLGLDSSIKEQEFGFQCYFEEREKRMQCLTESDFVEITLELIEQNDGARLAISCLDSGSGYEVKSYSQDTEKQFSGRGLAMIEQLSQRVEIAAPGNFIKAVI